MTQIPIWRGATDPRQLTPVRGKALEQSKLAGILMAPYGFAAGSVRAEGV